MKYFLASWDCHGFETIQDITDIMPPSEMQRVADILSDTVRDTNRLSSLISMVTMRARMNPQRNYEIYVQSYDDHISLEHIKEWSESDPQSLVDLIREKHYAKVYDDRASKTSRVIV